MPKEVRLLKKYCSVFVVGLLLICLSACGNRTSLPAESSGDSPPLLKDVVPVPSPDETEDESDIIDPAEEATRLSAPPEGTARLLDAEPPLSAGGGAAEPPASQEESVSPGEGQLQAYSRSEVLSVSGDENPPDETMPAVNPSEMELELVRLINREREANGLGVLGLEDTLSWAAAIRAPEAMGNLTHTRPNGQPYYTVFDEVGFAYAGKWHGENVTYMYFEVGAYDAVGAAGAMFHRLKDSSNHYQNMLSENFDQMGVGIYIESDDNVVRISSAQLFASL